MQNNLQDWDKQLKNIVDKKSKNGKISDYLELLATYLIKSYFP